MRVDDRGACLAVDVAVVVLRVHETEALAIDHLDQLVLDLVEVR